MPTIPSACQPLADQVSALEQQYTALATQAEALVGAPGWAALGQLGTLLEQLTNAREDLAQCVRTHSAALTGSLVVIDASGDGSAHAGQQTVTLWDLSASGAAAREVSNVQAGSFGFQGPLPARAAMTVQTAGVADLLGLDFRSGTLAGPLDGQTPRVEIVIGPRLRLPAKLLMEWAAAFQPVSPTGLGGVGMTQINVAISSLSVALAADVVTVTATGTLSGGFVIGPGAAIPMSAGISMAIAPVTDPQSDDVAAVTLAGTNPISVFTAVSPNIAGFVASALSSILGPFIQDALRNSVNEAIATAVATGLAIAQLPPDTRVSLRSVAIDQDGITFQPVLGLIGTGLSTFRPAPLPLP